MKILALADEECLALWDYYVPGRLKDFDLIIACGDLEADYLSFLVTMARCPVLYVHGNHDDSYDRHPPEGCDCIDDRLVVFNGVRIMGLGGSRRYRAGIYQYTEQEMRKRIRKLRFPIWLAGGVDIVVTHAPPRGYGDSDDLPHLGFGSMVPMLDKYKPEFLLHGHVHMTYDCNRTRELQYKDTRIINTFERYVLEIPDREVPERQRGQLIWKR